MVWIVHACSNPAFEFVVTHFADTYFTVDAAGNAYVTGLFTSGNITFGTISVAKPSQNGGNVFVAKLNAAGQWQWGAAGGGDWLEFPRRVRADAAGNVYVAGYFNSPVSTFGNSQISSGGSYPTSQSCMHTTVELLFAKPQIVLLT